MDTIIEVDGYRMTVSDIVGRSMVSRILDVMKEIDDARKPRLTDAEIEIVMRALAGEPILTSSAFANKGNQCGCSFSLYVFVYPIFRISNKSYTKKRRVNVWNQKLKAMRSRY